MSQYPSAPLDHQGLEVLSPTECWALLASVPVGRVGFTEAGEPVILPVNHSCVGHRVVFRTARGELLHEALMVRPVAFEVDGYDAERRTGWSVLVRGRVTLAGDELRLDALGLDAWADAIERDDWVAIVADEVTGRRIAPH